MGRGTREGGLGWRAQGGEKLIAGIQDQSRSVAAFRRQAAHGGEQPRAAKSGHIRQRTALQDFREGGGAAHGGDAAASQKAQLGGAAGFDPEGQNEVVAADWVFHLRTSSGAIGHAGKLGTGEKLPQLWGDQDGLAEMPPRRGQSGRQERLPHAGVN